MMLAANLAGFADVTNATLPASPITLTVPAGAPGSYNGTLVQQQCTSGCVSVNYPIPSQRLLISNSINRYQRKCMPWYNSGIAFIYNNQFT